METPKTLKEITLDFMEEYVSGLTDDDMEWFADMVETEVDATDKEGKPIKKKQSFIVVRNAFARKYFPDLAPKGTSRKANKMEDAAKRIRAKLAAKKK